MYLRFISLRYLLRGDYIIISITCTAKALYSPAHFHIIRFGYIVVCEQQEAYSPHLTTKFWFWTNITRFENCCRIYLVRDVDTNWSIIN